MDEGKREVRIISSVIYCLFLISSHVLFSQLVFFPLINIILARAREETKIEERSKIVLDMTIKLHVSDLTLFLRTSHILWMIHIFLTLFKPRPGLRTGLGSSGSVRSALALDMAALIIAVMLFSSEHPMMQR